MSSGEIYGMKPINVSELSSYVPKNDVEKDIKGEILMVAGRTGDPMELSALDALSYRLYKHRNGRCYRAYFGPETVQEEMCEQRVRTADEKFLQLGWYTMESVEIMLQLVPEDDDNLTRSTIRMRAVQLMDMANGFVEDIRSERREECCKKYCD